MSRIAVHLHGALAPYAPAPGEPLDLEVLSAGEAVLALTCIIPETEPIIRDGCWTLIAGGTAVGPDTLASELPDGATLHVTPHAGGSLPWFVWLGIGLLASVAVYALFPAPPTPELDAGGEEGSPRSYGFDGALNTAREGAPVPLIYGGPIRVGSAIITASVTGVRSAAIIGGGTPRLL